MSNGFFKSSITFDDLEKELQKRLKITNTFGEKKVFTATSASNGIVAEMGFLEPDWQGENTENLPKKLVVKICASNYTAETSRDALSELIQSEIKDHSREERRVKAHNCELNFYETFQGSETLPLVKFYGGRARTDIDNCGFIMLEYVESRSVHMCENLDDVGIQQILRALAFVQAYGLKNSNHGFEKQKLFGGILQLIVDKNLMEGYKKMFSNYSPHTELVEQMHKAMDDFTDEKYVDFIDSTGDLLGMKDTICHGDVWICNMLWPVGETEKLRDPIAIIDWQTPHLGCCAADLVRLFTGCLSTTVRRDNYMDYLHMFFEFLSDELGDQRMPFTIYQLVEAYHRMFPLAAFVVAVSIAAVGKQIVDKRIGEDEKKKAHDSLQEIHEGLMVDIVKEHERNRSLQSQLSTQEESTTMTNQ